MTVGILSNDSFGRFTFPDRRGAGAAPVRPRHRGLHVQRHRRSGARAAAYRAIAAASASTASSSPRAARTSASRSSLSRADLPVVYVFSQVENPDALCLLPDDKGGARLAVEHLAALGRKRIAHITGPERFEAVRLRDGRAIATRSRRPGLSLSAESCLRGRVVGSLGARGGRRAVRRRRRRARRALLRQRPDRPRRARRAARLGRSRARRGRGGRLRQLGGHGQGRAAAADQRRHESERARPRGGRMCCSI